MSVQIFCPFFKNWMIVFLFLGCWSSLYTLNTSTLSCISVANIFFQSVACLFSFVMVSFEGCKFFILARSNLSIFSLMFYACVF